MYSQDDTIVAIATPAGRGGIGIVRMSGPEALAIAGAMLPPGTRLTVQHATVTRIRTLLGSECAVPRAGAPSPDPRVSQDEAVVTWFAAPRSYTGEHVVEMSAHGSPVVLHGIVRSALAAGARLAEPGEFTLRAFLNGKRDLVQAEAVHDLVSAVTPLQARVAFDQLEGTLTGRIAEIDSRLFDLIARLEASLDFPDEGYHFVASGETAACIDHVIAAVERLLVDATRGRAVREGATVVVAGRTNVGKSSIFNALAGSDRAIVTPVPGTTRDLVTEPLDMEGLAVTLVDTAGLRETPDTVEAEGVRRGARAREVADVLLVVLDASEPAASEDGQILAQTRGMRRIIVSNKVDLVQPVQPGNRDSRDARAGELPSPVDVGGSECVRVSALTGDGIPGLRRAIVRALTGDDRLRDAPAVSNLRHVTLLEEARTHLIRARDAAGAGEMPEEFVLSDLQTARASFDEIVGARSPDDVLRHIFERFCIGK